MWPIIRKYRARFLMGCKRTLNTLRSPFYKGSSRFCPVCKKSSRKFASHGLDERKDAKCMRCGALERHRLMWLFFERKSDLFDGRNKTMLHVAPKPTFDKRLKSCLDDHYTTADLYNPQAMVKMDVTDIQYGNAAFDVICCSHVLEHVPNDMQALNEFYRVLKAGGWAVITVPITADETVEDPTITDPEKRLKKFGQKDHVRACGPDYAKRIEKAGFNVQTIKPKSFLNDDEITRMGITDEAGVIFYGTKE